MTGIMLHRVLPELIENRDLLLRTTAGSLLLWALARLWIAIS